MNCALKVKLTILPPGEFSIGDRQCRMQTLLGSGVVITLWHRSRRIGAMAHFLPASRGSQFPLELDGLAAPDGLQRVLQELHSPHIDTVDCVARICGTGELAARTDRVPSLNSGQSHGEFVRRMIRACGIPIASEKFYAMGRQRLIFNVDSGRIQARRISPVAVKVDAPPKTATASASPSRHHGVMRTARAG
jgi:chemotaxis receptor (MCP) glutamine deamidase CheD